MQLSQRKDRGDAEADQSVAGEGTVPQRGIQGAFPLALTHCQAEFPFADNLVLVPRCTSMDLDSSTVGQTESRGVEVEGVLGKQKEVIRQTLTKRDAALR